MLMTLPHERPHRLRIAFVLPSFGKGGMERCVANLVNHLDPSRYETVVISLTESTAAANWIEPELRQVIALNKRDGSNLRIVRELARELREQRIDLAYSHNWGTLLESVLAIRMAGTPFHIHAERGTVLGEINLTPARRRLRALATRWGLSRTDGIVCPSIATAKTLRDACGLPLDRISILPNGVSTPQVADRRRAREALRERMGVDERAVIFGSVGRLHPVKGFQDLIQALELACQRQVDARLVIVGGGNEDPETIRAAERSEFRDRIYLPGHQEQVGEWMAGMDVYVNSSHSEGLSQSVLEAMSLGLPLIVTDVGDHAEVVGREAGSCGLVVPPAQAAALADAMERLASDIALRRSCGENSQQRHRTQFSLESMMASYERLFDALGAPVTAGGR